MLNIEVEIWQLKLMFLLKNKESMHPELFTFSIFGQNVVIMAYGFFYILVSIFVIIASYFSARHNNFFVRQTFCLLGGGAVAGLLGARLLHFVFNPSIYMVRVIH